MSEIKNKGVSCPWCKEGGKHAEYVHANGDYMFGDDRCDKCRINVMYKMLDEIYKAGCE